MRVQPMSIPQNLFRLLGADVDRTGAADGKPHAPKVFGQSAADIFETPAQSTQASERSAAPSAIHSTSRTTAAALPSTAALQASASGWTFRTYDSALAVVSEVEISAPVAISAPPPDRPAGCRRCGSNGLAGSVAGEVRLHSDFT